MHYSKENPSCSTFRVITVNFRVSEILGFLRYIRGTALCNLYLSIPMVYSKMQEYRVGVCVGGEDIKEQLHA